MMKASSKYIAFFAAFLVLTWTSCQVEKEVFTEPQKDLIGTWKIVKVTRNANDITPYIDSSGFRLVLQSDNTYQLQSNNIPFVVNTGGTWSVDDPQYPYNLSFTATDSTNALTGSIATPVIKGDRNLNVTFSPGCRANTYIYTFQKLQ